MVSSDNQRTRLIHTPLLDKELARLEKKLRPDGARADLISFIGKRNGHSDRDNAIQISRVIHRARLPHAEFLLTVQAWLKRRK
jgi:hypothetical protein